MASRPQGVVVVGGSAGGVEALQDTVGGLPVDLRDSVLVVLHTRARAGSGLSDILGRAGPLPAHVARHGEHVQASHVYTCWPDHHLLLVDHTIGVTHGPAERGHRPSIDVLFRSAVDAFGAAVTGVLLSGVPGDGVDGMAAIKDAGGRTIVQDPADALFSNLPTEALRVFTPDHVVRAADIGAVLADDQTPVGSESGWPPG